MKVRLLTLFFALLFCTAAHCITLINDSHIVLNAVVQDATGQVMAENMVDPGTRTVWSYNSKYYRYQAQPAQPKLPFTVIWTCLSGAVYSTCSRVPLDGYVMASNCSGGHQCYYP